MVAMTPSSITIRTVIAPKLRSSNATLVTPSMARRDPPSSRRVSDTHSAFRQGESSAAGRGTGRGAYMVFTPGVMPQSSERPGSLGIATVAGSGIERIMHCSVFGA